MLWLSMPRICQGKTMACCYSDLRSLVAENPNFKNRFYARKEIFAPRKERVPKLTETISVDTNHAL
jgi:hypothetical protein